VNESPSLLNIFFMPTRILYLLQLLCGMIRDVVSVLEATYLSN
jgi:hypothetical protein